VHSSPPGFVVGDQNVPEHIDVVGAGISVAAARGVGARSRPAQGLRAVHGRRYRGRRDLGGSAGWSRGAGGRAGWPTARVLAEQRGVKVTALIRQWVEQNLAEQIDDRRVVSVSELRRLIAHAS